MQFMFWLEEEETGTVIKVCRKQAGGEAANLQLKRRQQGRPNGEPGLDFPLRYELCGTLTKSLTLSEFVFLSGKWGQ